jgi:hypothetical protein
MEEKIENVSQHQGIFKKYNHKSNTVYGTLQPLQSIKKNLCNKQKKTFPTTYRNQNSFNKILAEDGPRELLTDTNLPKTFLINVKDCKGIRKDKKSLKTQKHINDMQASKLVNNIFQKLKI